jgi:hypothetical protein
MSDEASSDLAALQVREETRTANAIYGIIVSTAVMASVKTGDSVGRLAVAVLVTLLIYWAAASSAASTAWTGIRPPATSCPPERRTTLASGAAQRFS